MKSILILFHCPSNVGYAIGPLERTFFEMAGDLCGQDVSRIHVGYPSMSAGPSRSLPADFRQYAVIDSNSVDPEHCRGAARYLREHDIDTIFGFDQPVSRPSYRYFRGAGVKNFISYWGAPMSPMHSLPMRLLKRLDVLLRRSGPDHYIFESHGMAELAVMGRGIPQRRVSVVPLGIDNEKFKPDGRDAGYLHETLPIPSSRRVFIYSGHMEARKGIGAIMSTANLLAERRREDDWHILLCGNKDRESEPYEKMLSDGARERVTFGGYRSDLPLLQRGCYAALIASTGWDSFPRSGLEMQASGLPLIVSNLRGIREVVEDGVTGIVTEAGSAAALAGAIEKLLDEPEWRDRLSRQARARIESGFTLQRQLSQLTVATRRVVSR